MEIIQTPNVDAPRKVKTKPSCKLSVFNGRAFVRYFAPFWRFQPKVEPILVALGGLQLDVGFRFGPIWAPIN